MRWAAPTTVVWLAVGSGRVYVSEVGGGSSVVDKAETVTGSVGYITDRLSAVPALGVLVCSTAATANVRVFVVDVHGAVTSAAMLYVLGELGVSGTTGQIQEGLGGGATWLCQVSVLRHRVGARGSDAYT